MKDDTPAGLRAVAHAVRTLRTVHGLTQDQLGKKIGYSRSQVNDVEHARVWPHVDFVSGCDRAFGTGALLVGLHGQGRDQGLPSWAAALVEAERNAVAIRSYQPSVIPGLLQTPDYARAVFMSGLIGGDELDRQVQRRMDRQRILDGLRSYHLVLDEAVLHRIIGSREITRAQGVHLHEAVLRLAVTVQVMPFAMAYPTNGPVTIIDCADGSTVVHMETPVGSTTTTHPDTVEKCRNLFDMLRTQAAPLAVSAQMIEARLEDLR